MSAIYELVGRLVITFVRQRYQRELRLAGIAALGAAALGAAAWAATHEPDDI